MRQDDVRMESPLCCFGSRKRVKTLSSIIPYTNGKIPNAPCYFKLLSNELILYIFRYLSTVDLCVVSRVSKRFRECAYDKTLWRNLVLNSSMNRRKLSAALKMMEQTQRLNCVRCVNLNNSNIRQSTVEYIITHTPFLREIRLHNLKLTEKTAKLLVSRCPNLEQVYMDGGRTSDECLELLANGAIRLKSINLHKVENITTNGICHIIKNTNLSFLNFNGISGWDIRTLAPYCSHFTSMDLGSSNNLTDEDLKSLTRHCKKLKYISLKNCKMITDTGIQELIADCPQLTDLNLATCGKLTRTSVQLALQQLHSLTSLNLSGFKQLHPIQFPLNPYRLLPHLVTLDLSFTDIDDDDILNACNYCANIKTLRLAGCCDVTDVSVSALATNCTKLTNLDLSRDIHIAQPMKITILSIAELARNCPDLTKINLSYSSRNSITKKTLLEVNECRLHSKLKLVTFHLNDDIVVS
jgi:hypothetical protein